jgi:hypothetical protein
MDVRAFGSVYGQSSALPYASGLLVSVSGDMVRRNFPASRGIFIERKSGSAKGSITIVMTDAQNSTIPIDNIEGDLILPFSITSVISGSVNNCIVLY